MPKSKNTARPDSASYMILEGVYIFMNNARLMQVTQTLYKLFCNPVEYRHIKGALF